MAQVIGCRVESVKDRIKNHPELNVFRPERDTQIELEPPTESETLTRSKKSDVSVADMAEVIEKTERLIHKGLASSGVPAETLKVLRSLHGLSVTSGQFLAQSVIDIQDLYSIELYKIPARLEEIKKNYLDDPQIPVMERMFWQRAHTELLDQLGKGKDRMIAGAEAISAMLRGKNGDVEKKATKAKPGW